MPHIHNLGFLRAQAELIDPRLIDVWPRETKADRANFEKLKDAYVKARYSKHCRTSEEELSWLGDRAHGLGRAVQILQRAYRPARTERRRPTMANVLSRRPTPIASRLQH